MKITLRGWGREVVQHNHVVKPVDEKPGKFVALKQGPLQWHNGLSAYGKVDKLNLTGSFLIKFEFEQAELRNWLLQFSQSNPAEALRLISEAQAEAMIAISTQANDEA